MEKKIKIVEGEYIQDKIGYCMVYSHRASSLS